MWAQITLNVALCRLRTREFRAAERDCTRVISQSAAVSEGELAKAHYRRATVRIAQANDKGGGEGDAGSTKELRGALLPTTRPEATSACGSLTRDRGRQVAWRTCERRRGWCRKTRLWRRLCRSARRD